MNITGILWLQKIVDKLPWKHHLSQDDVEEVFASDPQYRMC